MNKHQRALRAAKAAKRIPLVGTAVVLAPVLEAAVPAFGTNLANIANLQSWQDFLTNLKYRFTGTTSGSSSPDGTVIASTWIPIVVYAASYKLHLAKYANRVLGKIGLRF